MQEHVLGNEMAAKEARAFDGKRITEFNDVCHRLAVAEFGTLEWQRLRERQLELKALLERKGLLDRLDGWLKQVVRSIETHIPIRDPDQQIRLYPIPE